jgi:hypothetical protein
MIIGLIPGQENRTTINEDYPIPFVIFAHPLVPLVVNNVPTNEKHKTRVKHHRSVLF